MDIFPKDAFENRRKFITDFYLQGEAGEDREYTYLTEEEVDEFIKICVETILQELKKYI